MLQQEQKEENNYPLFRQKDDKDPLAYHHEEADEAIRGKWASINENLDRGGNLHSSYLTCAGDWSNW